MVATDLPLQAKTDMSKRARIGLREVRALKTGEMIWDTAVPGFAVRRQAGTAVTYVLKYRNLDGQRQRWYTIGRHGAPWTPDTARSEAQRLLGEVAKGRDPATHKQTRRKALTVAELCGHQGRSMTSRYVHTADAVLLAAADAVAERTLTLMRKGTRDTAASGLITSPVSTIAPEMAIADVA